MTDHTPYLDYIRNTGRDPLPIQVFDEDWAPIGSIVRAEMVAKGLIVEADGGLRIAGLAQARAEGAREERERIIAQVEKARELGLFSPVLIDQFIQWLKDGAKQ